MKVLVTGGAGFIGSHLAERHLTLGDEVCIVDDLSTGSIANIQHLKIHPGFTYHIDTVTNTQLMAELVDLCDVLYHLAAAVGVRLIVDSPVRTIETNIRGTEIVLALAEGKRKRVLITSASEVYGKRGRVPFREDDDLVMDPPNKGRWSYACSLATHHTKARIKRTSKCAGLRSCLLHELSSCGFRGRRNRLSQKN